MKNFISSARTRTIKRYFSIISEATSKIEILKGGFLSLFALVLHLPMLGFVEPNFRKSQNFNATVKHLKNFNESTKRIAADAGFIFKARHSYLEK